MIVKIKRQLKNCLQKRTLQECSRDGIGTIVKTRNLKMIEHKQDNTLRNDECKENRVLSSRSLSIKRLDQKSDLFFISEKAWFKRSLNGLFKPRFKPKIHNEYYNYCCLLPIKDTF